MRARAAFTIGMRTFAINIRRFLHRFALYTAILLLRLCQAAAIRMRTFVSPLPSSSHYEKQEPGQKPIMRCEVTPTILEIPDKDFGNAAGIRLDRSA